MPFSVRVENTAAPFGACAAGQVNSADDGRFVSHCQRDHADLTNRGVCLDSIICGYARKRLSPVLIPRAGRRSQCTGAVRAPTRWGPCMRPRHCDAPVAGLRQQAPCNLAVVRSKSGATGPLGSNVHRG